MPRSSGYSKKNSGGLQVLQEQPDTFYLPASEELFRGIAAREHVLLLLRQHPPLRVCVAAHVQVAQHGLERDRVLAGPVRAVVRAVPATHRLLGLARKLVHDLQPRRFLCHGLGDKRQQHHHHNHPDNPHGQQSQCGCWLASKRSRREWHPDACLPGSPPPLPGLRGCFCCCSRSLAAAGEARRWVGGGNQTMRAPLVIRQAGGGAREGERAGGWWGAWCNMAMSKRNRRRTNAEGAMGKPIITAAPTIPPSLLSSLLGDHRSPLPSLLLPNPLSLSLSLIISHHSHQLHVESFVGKVGFTIRSKDYYKGHFNTRLKAHDHCNLRVLIGRKGGDCPSSLHTRRWRTKGPKKTSWMKSLHGVLHGILWIRLHGLLEFSWGLPPRGGLDVDFARPLFFWYFFSVTYFRADSKIDSKIVSRIDKHHQVVLSNW